MVCLGICVWIPCIKETMMIIIIISHNNNNNNLERNEICEERVDISRQRVTTVPSTDIIGTAWNGKRSQIKERGGFGKRQSWSN
jgi:hypothetical protein